MADIRAEIDRLDRALVRLMAERQTYIERAGVVKGERARVRDPQRIEDVVSKIKLEATQQGLSADVAEPVWRTMVDRFIAHEFKIFDQKDSSEPQAQVKTG
jgi:isochorismate pyruvate lyase